MINRIISNLPFNPSLVEELSFYSKRLRQEKSIRRIGFVMLALSLLVQIFAATFPVEKSLAASDNDVIRGGVNNLQQLRNKYNSQADVKALYQRFGLEIGDLRDGGAQHINFGFHDQGSQGTKTVGRINFSYTNSESLGRFAGSTFYSRSASEWQGSTAAFAFGKQTGSDGRDYLVWVLKDCGNIAYRPVDNFQAGVGPQQTVEKPKPQPKKPNTTPKFPIATSTPTSTPTPVPTPEIPIDITAEKFAVNLTQNLSAKQTTAIPAKANDVIEYTLITKSKTGKVVNNYTIEDYVGDLLDYAELDMASISAQGGKYNTSNKNIVWENQTIPAEPTGLKKTFKVTLKSSIPKTNSPNATAPDFDCLMQNGYGSQITIRVDCSVIKNVETLPNTGPGETIAISFTIASLAGYFLSRNGLLSKELFIIRRNYAISGDK